MAGMEGIALSMLRWVASLRPGKRQRASLQPSTMFRFPRWRASSPSGAVAPDSKTPASRADILDIQEKWVSQQFLQIIIMRAIPSPVADLIEKSRITSVESFNNKVFL